METTSKEQPVLFEAVQELMDELESVCKSLNMHIPVSLRDKFQFLELETLTRQGRDVLEKMRPEEPLDTIAAREFERLKKRLEPRIENLKARLWNQCRGT